MSLEANVAQNRFNFTYLQAWLNEKFSPEFLENRSDIVDCMLEQVHEMEENIRRAKKGDFKVSIHKMEVNFYTHLYLFAELCIVRLN